MYDEKGYARREIPTLILKNNLVGLDVDKRAAQLASFALVMKARKPGEKEELEYARIPWDRKETRLRAAVRFPGLKGEVQFSYQDGAEWKPLGPVHTMAFALDHFTGCRFGLFLYAAEETGGSRLVTEIGEYGIPQGPMNNAAAIGDVYE